jgi:hypothetical protein
MTLRNMQVNDTEAPPSVGRGVVPYITAWSDEKPLPNDVIVRPGVGIAFADETSRDRDSNGVLWTRVPSRPGQGRPVFGQTHSRRQRRAMRRLLCQVCGCPADRNKDGVLWLLRDHREDWENWPEGMASTEPPVCMKCAVLAARMCPALRSGHVAIRVRRFPISAVRGVRYRPAGGLLLLAEATVALDDTTIRWTRAAQLVRSLRGCTIVNVDQGAA